MFSQEISEYFARLGHETRSVYLYEYKGDRALPLRDGDVELRGMEAAKLERFPGIHPGLLGALRREIAAFRPDIVQVNGARTVKYGAMAKRLSGARRRCKLVYRNIDIASYWNRGDVRVAVYRRMFMSQMDGAIWVSNAAMLDGERLYRLSVPSVTIPNGINTKKLVADVSREDLRRRLGAAPGDLVLLFVGSLVNQKRPDRFLRIVAKAAAQIPGVRAWLVGDGPLRPSLEEQADALGIRGRCTFFGYTEAVAEFMLASDLMVMTSDTEGLPAVALEAQYAGLPVVTTDVGGVAEAVLNERTGIVVERPFEVGLLDAVCRLAADRSRRIELGAAAHVWASENFSIERTGERYLEYFRALLPR